MGDLVGTDQQPLEPSAVVVSPARAEVFFEHSCKVKLNNQLLVGGLVAIL